MAEEGNARSVLDIEVNSQAWEKFAESYDEYRDKVHTAPEDWEKAAKAQAAMFSQFEKLNAAISKQSTVLKGDEAVDKERVRRLRDNESLWGSMAKHTQSMAKNVLDIGSGLLKWGSLIGGGVLFGAAFGLDRLAHSMSDTRSTAMGFGVSPSMLQAFGDVFGKFMDTQGFLTSMVGMETDQTKAARPWSAMRQYGLGDMTHDTAKDSFAFLDAMRNFARQNANNPNMGLLAQAYQLPMDVTGLKNLAGMDDAEWAQKRKAAQTNMGLDDRTARSWQNLATQFDLAADRFKNQVGTALTKLTPKLTALSDAAGGMTAAFLKSPQVSGAIDRLTAYMDSVAKTGKSPEGKSPWSMLNPFDPHAIVNPGTYAGALAGLVLTKSMAGMVYGASIGSIALPALGNAIGGELYEANQFQAGQLRDAWGALKKRDPLLDPSNMKAAYQRSQATSDPGSFSSDLASAQSVFAPQGTGVTILIVNAAQDAHVVTNQLGSR